MNLIKTDENSSGMGLTTTHGFRLSKFEEREVIWITLLSETFAKRKFRGY